MRYITIPQLAKVMSVSRATVYRKVRSGEIAVKKVGRTYVISNEDIDRALNEELTDSDKERIDRAVEKVIEEYGEVLRRLGSE